MSSESPYYVTLAGAGHTVSGPGIGFISDEGMNYDEAESLARNLSRAYRAGQDARSREILDLLGGKRA